MKALWLAVLLLGSQQGQETVAKQADSTATFKNVQMGLTFTYPKEWKLSEKKTKKTNWFEFEVPTKSGTAHIEVFGLYFRSEKDIFQISQSHAVKQAEAELVKQWEEEILGAPLLLTQSKKKSDSILVGLVYSFSYSKLMFRITTPEAAFEDVNYLWRQSLQSLRTISGDLLKPENPDKFLPGEGPSLGPNTVRIGGVPNPYGSDGKVEATPTVQIPGKAAGRPVILAAPEGWEGKVSEDGTKFELTNPKLGTPIEVRLASVITAEPPARALFSQSLETLKLFNAVLKRSEFGPAKNRSGAMYSYIWREGNGEKGSLIALDAAGSVDQFYWILSYRAEKLDKEGREQLQGLVDRLFLIIAS